MMLGAALLITLVIAGTPVVMMEQLNQAPERPLLYDFIFGFLKDFLPCHGPCIVNAAALESFLLYGNISRSSSISQCINDFPRLEASEILDFIGSPNRICPAVRSFVSCFFSRPSALPCEKYIEAKFTPLLDQLLSFLDCDVSDSRYKLDLVKCMVTPVLQPSPEFEMKLNLCVKSLSDKPAGEMWSSLYEDYVTTGGPSSKICKIVKTVPQCVLEAYKSTLWKYAVCDNVQAEILRQAAHIGVKINCNGNGKADIIGCLGNTDIYRNIPTACLSPNVSQNVIGDLTAVVQGWATGSPPEPMVWFKEIFNIICVPFRTLSSCFLKSMSTPACEKTVVPLMEATIHPLQYHVDRFSDTCAPKAAEMGPCQCPDNTMITCIRETTATTSADTTITEEITSTVATVTEEITSTVATTTTLTTSAATTSSSGDSDVLVAVSFKLNQDFDDNLKNPSSTAAKALVAIVTAPITKAMKKKYGTVFKSITTPTFSSGSIKVDFNVVFNTKPPSSAGSPSNILSTGVRKVVAESLQTGLVGTKYTVDPASVTTKEIKADSTTPPLLTVLLTVTAGLLAVVCIVLLVLCMCYCSCNGRNPYYRNNDDVTKNRALGPIYSGNMGAPQQGLQRILSPVLSYRAVNNPSAVAPRVLQVYQQPLQPRAYYQVQDSRMGHM